jgi:hypothetical protein
VDIAKASLCFATPDKLFASINLKWVTAQAPTCELEADIINNGFLGKAVGNPSR